MTITEPAGRASPPTARVVAILEFLARHPQDRFGLSELARRVSLSKPTCLGIVTTLAEAGYLVRDPTDKTYRLGPALITLGHTAQETLRVSPSARTELRALSEKYDATAALSGVVDDRITLLELVAPTGTRVSVRVGQSYPFAPPVGLMFVLWDEQAVRDWLAKEPTIPLRTDSERLERVIAECRRTGYLVERLTPGGRRLYALMAGMSSTLPDELQALLGELVSDIGERVYLADDEPLARRADGREPLARRADGREPLARRADGREPLARKADGRDAGARARHDISVIAAPVFDHHQRQVMVVSLQIGHALTDSEISKRARGVVATATALTAQLGGSKP